jgi:DNA replication and repair protein RecF
VIVRHLALRDFRNYTEVAFALTGGTTAVLGDNGQGKTNFVEALAYLATLVSFRAASADALIRVGADTAVVRAEIEHDDGRHLLVEAEINRSGRNRVFVNRQRLVRSRDLLGVLRVSVFAPDDLVLVKGGPAERREFTDTALVALAAKHDLLRRDLERIVRQRTTLLKQAAGRLSPEVELTLDVWDAKLSETGEALGAARAALIDALAEPLTQAYSALAGRPSSVGARYDPPWRRQGLASALAAGRAEDLRRQASLIGPHRDDVELVLNAMPARTHASQGEQRTLALALRLAVHRLITDTVGTPPVLVLDDVLSELDEGRARALLDHLPTGQVVLTSATALPAAARPERVLRIVAGSVIEDGP